MPLYSESLPFIQTLAPALRPAPEAHLISALGSSRKRSINVLRSPSERSRLLGWWNRGREVSAGGNALGSDMDVGADDGLMRKRKIVEHIFLLRAKMDLSDVEEKDMLDHLYTSQYHTSGVIAISLGRIEDSNVDNFTHAVYMRFQKKENLEKFYANTSYSGVLKEHVMPFCYGSISVDYESEVEDDILPIFRKGEEFNCGVECVVLIAMLETAVGQAVEEAVAALQSLLLEFNSVIVQATQGANFNLTDSMYTHAAVIRFSSAEAFEMFRSSSEYHNMWESKFQPLARKAVLIHYNINPVGTELM